MGLELDDRLDSILLGHVKVGDDEVAPAVTPETQRFYAVTRLGDLVPGSAEENVKRTADPRVVIDDHDPLSRCSVHSALHGRAARELHTGHSTSR
jgi:hypothetical protein